MFNIGAGEMMLIALVLLIAVGPEQLPGLIRRTGRVVGQFKTMSDNLRRDFNASLDEIERATDVKGWSGELDATIESVKEGAVEPFKTDLGIDGSTKVKDIWSRPPIADADVDAKTSTSSEVAESPTTEGTDEANEPDEAAAPPPSGSEPETTTRIEPEPEAQPEADGAGNLGDDVNGHDDNDGTADTSIDEPTGRPDAADEVA